MDFILSTYRTLIETLQKQGFLFSTYREFVSNPEGKIVILRHDVDSLPGNSLRFARIQADLGIKGTYYFRIVPQSFDEKIIKEIFSLGHEVGYHYEDVSLVAERQKTKVKRQKGGGFIDITSQRHNTITEKKVSSKEYEDYEIYLAGIAIESFKENLAKLRELVPVKTICMHGRPMSRWDSRLLWKYYDYRDFGIIGEPYFDIDFNKVCYITDTGRMWDGDSFNIRDKGTGNRQQAIGEENRMPHAANLKPFPKFHTTFDIIRAAEEDRLPDKIMMTFHPQRWTDKPLPWVRELVWQNVKNVGKYFLVKWRD